MWVEDGRWDLYSGGAYGEGWRLIAFFFFKIPFIVCIIKYSTYLHTIMCEFTRRFMSSIRYEYRYHDD